MHTLHSKFTLSKKTKKSITRKIQTFHSKDLKLEKREKLKKKNDLENLAFGVDMTDYMLTIKWTKKNGWEAPLIGPYQNLSLDPSVQALHYAVQCFEGMKAYKDEDGCPVLFRPWENARRLKTSSERLLLPAFDENEFLECLYRFVDVERDWIPNKRDYSLYLRPTFISVTPQLGVSPTQDALLYVIASPVGPYYKSGFQPISLYASKDSIRAARGGTGNFKIGANYGPTILHSSRLQEKGHSQILWLYENEVTEVGTMNFFVYWINEDGEKELITAPLGSNLVLPGVTRDSILKMARDYGEFKVSEQSYTIQQFCKAASEGRIIECFGSGTAAVISPVKGVEYDDQYYTIPTGDEIGPLSKRLWDDLTAIHYGDVASDWTINIDKRIKN